MSEIVQYPNSTNVTELAYSPGTDDASPKLTATFKDGKRYAYSGVPLEVWNQLKAASMTGRVGAIFSQLIKTGGYAYARLDDDLDLEEASAAGPLEEAPRRHYTRVSGPAQPLRPRPARNDDAKRQSIEDRRRSKR